MADQDDELEDDELDGPLEQMLVENGMLVQAMMNLLTRKGIITESEVQEELEALYKELGDEFEDSGRE